MSDDREYDAEIDITAGELRHLGLPISDNIPDVAWIPRTAFLGTRCDFEEDDSTGIVRGSLEFMITKPFRWITMTVQLADGHEP